MATNDRKLCITFDGPVHNLTDREFVELSTNRVTTLFQKVFSMTFPRRKMKIHDLSALHIFSNKRYTTYECLQELLVTVAAASSSVVKKIKSAVFLHMFTNISQQEVYQFRR